MKTIGQSDFERGRGIAKWMMVAALILSVSTLFFVEKGSSAERTLMVVTITMIVATFAEIAIMCRCPHCGKVIIFGLLAAKQCPKCNRSLTSGKKVKKL